MFNKVILSGSLGQDVELKKVNDTDLAKFSLATYEIVGDQKKTEWHKIEVWGKIATLCDKYLSKGSKVLIEGSIRTSSWEKDGEKRYMTSIRADQVKFLDKKPEEKKSEENIEIPF